MRRLIPLLLLALLPVLFLWKLTLAGRILVGLDPFNFFYPYHDAVAAALAAGRLPQWNPTLFGGVPFLADSQAQLFYPLAWPFLALPAPSALVGSVVLHLAIAGLGCYAWARTLGLGRWGGWLAAALFALSPYVGAQIEHVNQVQAAAWLPWLLVGYERARADAGRRGGHFVALGAVALALSLLAGHAQTTFMGLVLLGGWALLAALGEGRYLSDEVARTRRSGLYLPLGGALVARLARGVLLPLLLIVGVGGLLAAVQLVPTQQLSALSTRAGGLRLAEAAAFSLDPRVLPRALLPNYGLDGPLLSEYVAWTGLAALLLAALGAWRGRGPARRFGLLSAGLGLLLALGGYNPLFWLLWRVVPGFDLFRVPARWLLLWVLGVALLAGAGLDVESERPKLRGLWARTQARIENRRALFALLLGGLLLLALFLVVGAWPPLAVLPWWAAVGAALALLWALRRRWPGRSPLPWAALLVALALAELWAMWWGLALQGATAPEAYRGMRPVPAHLITAQPPLAAGRILSLSQLTWDPGDLAALDARHAGLLGEQARYDLVVSTKLKEVLAPNQPMRWGLRSADGYGGGLLPSARWVTFQATLPLAKVVPDGRLREQLTALPRPALLDVMGVEWLVADKVLDWWSDNVYHDLGAPVTLRAGERLRWESGPQQASALSLVVIGAWPDAPGSVLIGGQRLDLAAADERATRETARGIERHLVLALDPPLPFEALEIEAATAWTLGALSLVDGRLPAFQPLPAEPALATTFSGDVKVYRRQAGAGRAWVVPRASSVADASAAATLLAEPSFDPRATVLVEGAAAQQGGAGSVTWRVDEAERIELEVRVPQGGWLVLADAPAPGWRATVDGQRSEWLAANVIGRALWLPAGSQRVTWQYEAPGLRLGLAGSLAGLLLLAMLLGWRRGR